MSTAKQLFQAGQLNEAVRALGAEVRDNPTDAQRRTFLFELLCFSGEYDRAEKHLNVLADGNPIYTLQMYNDALLFLPICIVVALLLTLFIKETYRQSTFSNEMAK